MHIRESREIIADILRASILRKSLTRIMYEVFLSHNQTRKYLKLLQRYDLIIYDDKTRHYITTDKGKKYLQSSDEIARILSSARNGEDKGNVIYAENKR